MSKICLRLELIFDNAEAWGNVSEFAKAFRGFLESQSLNGEDISTGHEDLNNFYLYVSRGADPIMASQNPTVKKSFNIIKEKAEGKNG